MKVKNLLALILIASPALELVASAPAGKCFCSRICDYRNQKPDDQPVQGENGIVFCKIWDKNNYNKRCTAKKRR